MRLPRLFYTLMLPLVWSAVSIPREAGMLTGASDDTGAGETSAPAAQAPAGGGTLRVADRGDGHFQVDGRFGARRIPMVVDTGASMVALTWETGRDLGLVHPGDTMDLPVSTANGTAQGKAVTLDRLEIGPIEVDRVKAVAMPQGALSVNLLGMSFLSRLSRFEIARGDLVLDQ